MRRRHDGRGARQEFCLTGLHVQMVPQDGSVIYSNGRLRHNTNLDGKLPANALRRLGAPLTPRMQDRLRHA